MNLISLIDRPVDESAYGLQLIQCCFDQLLELTKRLC